MPLVALRRHAAVLGTPAQQTAGAVRALADVALEQGLGVLVVDLQPNAGPDPFAAWTHAAARRDADAVCVAGPHATFPSSGLGYVPVPVPAGSGPHPAALVALTATLAAVRERFTHRPADPVMLVVTGVDAADMEALAEIVSRARSAGVLTVMAASHGDALDAVRHNVATTVAFSVSDLPAAAALAVADQLPGQPSPQDLAALGDGEALLCTEDLLPLRVRVADAA